MQILNATRGTTLATEASRATGVFERMKGLLGRASLAEGEALQIDPCNSIHTFFMRFPIDVLFVDKEGLVLRAFSAIRPWRLTRVYFQAKSVIELPAGTLEKTQTFEGDRIQWGPLD